MTVVLWPIRTTDVLGTHLSADRSPFRRVRLCCGGAVGGREGCVSGRELATFLSIPPPAVQQYSMPASTNPSLTRTCALADTGLFGTRGGSSGARWAMSGSPLAHSWSRSSARVRQLRHYFGPLPSVFLSCVPPPPHAPCNMLYSAHAYTMLFRACDPMLTTVHRFTSSWTHLSIHHSSIHAASGASVGTFTDTSNNYPCYEGTATSFIHFGPFFRFSLPIAIARTRRVICPPVLDADWCLQSECHAQFTSSGGENCCQFCPK